jgi:hypothetical protein
MADDRNAAAALIEELERLLERGGDEGKLRRAMSLAAEAIRMPAGDRPRKLLRDARELLRQAQGGET